MQSDSKLRKIINALDKKGLLKKTVSCEKSFEIKGITIDSREVEKDFLFICIKGFNFDGHDFAKDAITKGASAIVCERELENKDICQIIVKDSKKAEAIIAAEFYNAKKHKFKLIGITGTNGKTTISYLIKKMLSSFGYRCGVIGTLGYSIENNLYPLDRTTPDAIKLHEILYLMKNLDFVIMEVSSHSLALDRVYDIKFDMAIFTNLTQDHLDFHKTIEEYANTKYKLFEMLKENGIAVFNIDDSYGKEFYDKLKKEKYSVGFKNSDYQIKNFITKPTGTVFEFETNKEIFKYETKLIGRFNIYNIMLSIVAVNQLIKIELIKLKSFVKNLNPPKGRLQKFKTKNGAFVFVDYAHTPDAIKNVLSALYELKTRRIITVFGAGGNRDISKRPKMYKEAIAYSDVVIVTSDNPRYESPAKIINDIFSQGFNKEKTLVYLDRKQAIINAIRLAKRDDIVLIAGKGHENYQEIKGKKYPFDDMEIAKEAQDLKPKGNLFISISLFWINKIYDKRIPDDFQDGYFDNIFTDSRKVTKNSVFFAFKGEKFDAHNYVNEVLDNENVFAIINEEKKQNFIGEKVITVKNTIEAYGILAKFYKSILSPYTIAVTGSSGKTTTKEFLSSVFSYKYSTFKSKANENNQIGVPKTIFEYQNQEFLIVELGTNHFGEIEYLADIAKPNLAIITNIGNAHLEFFKTKNNVFDEKKNIFRFNPEIRIVDGDDEFLKECNAIKIGFKDNNDFRISDVKISDDKTEFKLSGMDFVIKTPFSVFVKNASFAIVAALKNSIPYLDIYNALKKEISLPLRMEIIGKNGIIFLNDCYNANPDSMSAAIDFWKDYLPDKPHFAILGDMLELGEYSEEFHKKIGEKLSKIKKCTIYSVGEFADLYNSNKHFSNVEEFLESKILNRIPSGSVVLIKASHGIGLDKIVRSL